MTRSLLQLVTVAPFCIQGSRYQAKNKNHQKYNVVHRNVCFAIVVWFQMYCGILRRQHGFHLERISHIVEPELSC